MESWTERFKEFFKKIDNDFSMVFDAGGVREMWLQGELYRHFTPLYPGFKVNWWYDDPRIKVDLYSNLPTEMVAEIKVYGLKNYQKKNLDGTTKNIKKYLDKIRGSIDGRIFFSKEIIENELTDMGEGTYLSDVRRLHKITKPIEKYMILVLKKEKEEDIDDFGKVIRGVRVSNDEYVVGEKEKEMKFLVRISRL